MSRRNRAKFTLFLENNEKNLSLQIVRHNIRLSLHPRRDLWSQRWKLCHHDREREENKISFAESFLFLSLSPLYLSAILIHSGRTPRYVQGVVLTERKKRPKNNQKETPYESKAVLQDDDDTQYGGVGGVHTEDPRYDRAYSVTVSSPERIIALTSLTLWSEWEVHRHRSPLPAFFYKKMNYAKIIFTILATAIVWSIIFSSVRHYSSSEYIDQVYKQEMATLSWEIQSLRADREKAKSEWEKLSTSLSGQITDRKVRLEIVELCRLSSTHPDECREEKKQSFINFIQRANAKEYRDQESTRINGTLSGVTQKKEILWEGKGTLSATQGSGASLQSGGVGRVKKEILAIDSPRLDLSGSHDYRYLAPRYPWSAGWKNNNPTWLTYRASRDLEYLWDTSNVSYWVGTARPRNEWGNYYNFRSIEDGLRGSIIAKKERWKKATVRQFLKWWGTGGISGWVNLNKRIWELSEAEFMNLFIHQIKKESPGLVSQLVKDRILIIE